MSTRSKSTILKKFASEVKKSSTDVFNSEFFGVYEGIIEKVDIENSLVNVRIPAIDNTLYEEVRCMSPCYTDTAAILPYFKINTHVMVAFLEFNLGKPIILGQINEASNITTPSEDETLILRNGDCYIKITESDITIKNKVGQISLTTDKMKLMNKNVTLEFTSDGLIINSPGSVVVSALKNISLYGTTGVTANGEDLTKDEIGVI